MEAYERDLTSGSVVKQLIAFGFPVLMANLLQAVYSVVDMLVVGHYLGGLGLSAVSIGGQVINIISSFCIGFCTGGQIVVAQFYGAGERGAIRRAANTLFALCLALAVILPCAGLSLKDWMLGVMNTPAECYAETEQYVVVCLVCILFTLGYHGISSVLRGMGDSRMPLVFIAVATVLNVILDIVFVGPLGLGVAGAAYATVIAQGVAFVCSVVYLLRRRLPDGGRGFDARVLGMIIKVGIPIAVQQTVINIGGMFASSIINSYGLTYSSASGIGMKLENFAFLPHIAISAAVSTVVGQSIGAGKPERAGQATRAGVIINIAIGALTIAVMQAFAPQIVGLFDTEPDVVGAGVIFLRITCFSYVLGGTAVALNGLSTGVGDAWFTLITVLSTHLLLRIAACYIIHYVLALPLIYVYISYTVTPVLSIILSVIYCLRGKWREHSLVAQQA